MKTLFTFVALAMLLTLSTTLTFGQSPESNPKCEDFGYNRSVKIEGSPFNRVIGIPSIGSIETILPDSKTVDFSTTTPAFVRAIIVKGGPDATVKHYNPAVWFDNGIRPPANSNGTIPDISHIEFCYHLLPTSAPVSLQGRVVDKYGRGVSSARVAAIDLETGIGKYAYTNGLGNYLITDLKIGAYMVGVTSKAYKFPTYTLNLNQDYTGLIFTAQ
jgi:hypothetical protein